MTTAVECRQIELWLHFTFASSKAVRSRRFSSRNKLLTPLSSWSKPNKERYQSVCIMRAKLVHMDGLAQYCDNSNALENLVIIPMG